MERNLLLLVDEYSRVLKGKKAPMGHVLYKDHTIVNGGRPFGSGRYPTGFTPVAVISWKRPDRQRRVLYRLELPKLYSTKEDATTAALQEAKAWVDQHSVQFERASERFGEPRFHSYAALSGVGGLTTRGLKRNTLRTGSVYSKA